MTSGYQSAIKTLPDDSYSVLHSVYPRLIICLTVIGNMQFGKPCVPLLANKRLSSLNQTV